MKNKYLMVMIALSAILTGCNSPAEEKASKEKFDNLILNGTEIDVGIVDGCSVKKYQKYTPKENIKEEDKYYFNSYHSHTFYIAKCDGKQTTTTTQELGHKVKHDEAMIKVDKTE